MLLVAVSRYYTATHPVQQTARTDAFHHWMLAAFARSTRRRNACDRNQTTHILQMHTFIYLVLQKFQTDNE